MWVAAAFAGALTRLDTVWAIADVLNGAMAVPNLIALLGLAGVIVRETAVYFTGPDPAT
jgi:AGCS family alanine or glycine:cation symporter